MFTTLIYLDYTFTTSDLVYLLDQKSDGLQESNHLQYYSSPSPMVVDQSSLWLLDTESRDIRCSEMMLLSVDAAKRLKRLEYPSTSLKSRRDRNLPSLYLSIFKPLLTKTLSSTSSVQRLFSVLLLFRLSRMPFIAWNCFSVQAVYRHENFLTFRYAFFLPSFGRMNRWRDPL